VRWHCPFSSSNHCVRLDDRCDPTSEECLLAQSPYTEAHDDGTGPMGVLLPFECTDDDPAEPPAARRRVRRPPGRRRMRVPTAS
jgi:hypothetical protein